MTPDEMKQRSSEKMKQITDLMRLLNVHAEAKQVINKGVIENMVIWVDNEQYPKAEVPPQADGPAAPAPTQNEKV